MFYILLLNILRLLRNAMEHVCLRFFFPFFLATRFPVELHRSKPLISLVPFNLHFHCFQGWGHCYVTNHKPCLESVQVDLFTYLINIVLFVRIISRFIKLFGFVIHFFQGWYRNIMSLALFLPSGKF